MVVPARVAAPLYDPPAADGGSTQPSRSHSASSQLDFSPAHHQPASSRLKTPTSHSCYSCLRPLSLLPRRGCWPALVAPSVSCCWQCLQPGPTSRTSRGPTPSFLAALRSSAAETALPFHGAEQRTDSPKSQLVRLPVSPAIDDLVAGVMSAGSLMHARVLSRPLIIITTHHTH